jgi:hypothetical protein
MATGRGVGTDVVAASFGGRRRLQLQLGPHLDRIVADQREAGHQVVAEPEQRVHRARGRHRADRKLRPVRELLGHQQLHLLDGDRQLAGVHGHQRRDRFTGGRGSAAAGW